MKRGKRSGLWVGLAVLTVLALLVLSACTSAPAPATGDKGTAAKPAAGDKGPIKIGLNMDLTGPLAQAAANIRQGYELYLDEVGYKVAGRQIQTIENDNRADGKLALEVAKKHVEKDNVHIMAGFVGSPGAMAIKGYLDTAKLPTVIIGFAGAEQVTLPPNRYLFRTSYADGQNEVTLGRYAFDKLGYKKMAVFGPDFVGGTGKLYAFMKAYEERGGQIAQTILHPFGIYDFAPYFATFKPDIQAFFVFEPGDIAVERFLSQFFELGLNKKMGLVVNMTMAQDYQAVAIFGEKMVGTYSSMRFTPSFDSPESKAYVQRFKAKYGPNSIPSEDSENGYTGMKWIVETLQAVNGNAEDTEGFLKAFKASKVMSPTGPMVFDDNQNVVRDFLITRVEKTGNVVQNVVKEVVPQVKQPPAGWAVMPQERKQ